MSTLRWIGTAEAVSQVTTLTIGGTIEAGDVFNVTIGGKTLSTVAANTDADDVAAQIVAAWNALSKTYYPEFAEITAAAVGSGGQLTLTHDTPGVPFTVTLETTESGGGAADDQTFGQSSTTAATGPNFWDNAENWSTGSVPVSSDDVVFEDNSVSVLYGLNASAVTLDSLTIKMSYTGSIGLSVNNSAGYSEYRDIYLQIGATAIDIGEGSGNGSTRIYINTGSAQTTLSVYGSSSGREGTYPIIFKGTHASNAAYVLRGSVDVAPFAGEAATIATLAIGYISSQKSDAKVRLSSGVTATNIEKSGGELDIDCASTTFSQTEGTSRVTGGTHAAVDIDGGTTYYTSTGTLTTLNIGSGGVFDTSGDMKSKTVTNCNLYSGGSIKDPFRKVTFTNGIDLVRCRMSDVKLDLGNHFTLSLSNI